MTITGSSTGLYSGRTLAQLKAGVLSRLGIPAGSYTRYTEEEITDELNEALRDFVVETRCLKGHAIITLKANYREYKVPQLFLDFINPRYPAFFRSEDGTGYRRLEFTSITRLDNASGSWRDDTGTPQAIYMGSVYGNTLLIGLDRLPEVSGDKYIIGTDAGIFEAGSNVTIGGNIAGTHKAGFAASAVYVDALGRDLVALGAAVGMVIRNETDGSSGVITAIGNQDAVNDQVTVTLSGGVDNQFDEADVVTIFSGEYGVISDWDEGGEKTIFSSELGALANITVPNGNIFMPYYRYAADLIEDTQYPEIPRPDHRALEWRAAAILLGTEHDGRIDQGKAQSYMAMYTSIVNRRKGKAPMLEAIEPDPDYLGEL